MEGEDLIKKLVLRSSDDLLAAIHEQARRKKGRGDRGRPSWQKVIRSAQAEGIFSEAEARRFLRLFSDEDQDAA